MVTRMLRSGVLRIWMCSYYNIVLVFVDEVGQGNGEGDNTLTVCMWFLSFIYTFDWRLLAKGEFRPGNTLFEQACNNETNYNTFFCYFGAISICLRPFDILINTIRLSRFP